MGKAVHRPRVCCWHLSGAQGIVPLSCICSWNDVRTNYVLYSLLPCPQPFSSHQVLSAFTPSLLTVIPQTLSRTLTQCCMQYSAFLLVCDVTNNAYVKHTNVHITQLSNNPTQLGQPA